MDAQPEIRCPSCGHRNRSDRRYCAACGGHLGQACSSCGTRNNPEEKFCGACGAALSGAAAEGERRQLTVLFCDLVGSTALAGQLDPEDWREVMTRYQHAAAETITRFGGHVAKYLGDGLLAYFSYPQAHEDDPERAVRAGLALLDTVAELNHRLEPIHGVQLAVRIGMHTGPVVIGEGAAAGAEVFGDTPNVAARVQTLAEPNTVLITETTHRLVAGRFIVEAKGAPALKGVRTPVAVYRVVQASGVRSRLAAAAARGLTPFVGREHERRLLRERFEQAREGKGQVVMIVGEPGIGKSRLAQVLHEDLAGVPHIWLESGGALYFANTPFYAVIGLLGQIFLSGARADDSPEDRVAALERALEAAGLSLPEALPLVAPLLDLPIPTGYPPVLAVPEVARKRLLATLASWVFGAARLQLMVILLEDLQWVDPSTLELQRFLVEQATTAPLLLLYTARLEFKAPWALRAHHTQLTLNRLPRRHVREVVANVAAPAALPAEVVNAVVARTDGVPLFVEELTKAAMEAGAQGLRGIPATLADSLMARLDRLWIAKQVAQVGAVLGREFSFGLLRAVHPVPADNLEDALEKLVDAKLLYARGVPPDATFIFKHTLVQETAYASLLKTRRRQLHGLAAKALTERFAEIAEEQPELLAHHYTEAGEAERAAEEWQRAGTRTLDRGALREAEQHVRRGLDVLATLPDGPQRDEREFRLQLLLGQALAMTKFAAPETAAAWERARVLGERVTDSTQGVFLLMGLWGPALTSEGPAAAWPLAEQVLAAAERAALQPLEAWAHFAQFVTRHHAGDLTGAAAHLARALALCDEATASLVPFDPRLDPRLVTLCNGAILAWHLGLADQARAHARKGLELAERAPGVTGRPFAERAAALLHTLLREPAAALEHATRAIAKGSEQPSLVAEAMMIRGWALAEEGQPDEGVAAVREGLGRMVAAKARLLLEHYLGLLADAHARAGQVGDALAALTEAEGAMPGEDVWRADTLRRRGELLALRGADPAEIEATFGDALAMANRQGAKAYELRVATCFGRWLCRNGRAAEARALLAPLYAWFTEGFDTRDLVEAKALLEELG